jgi:hypothetical protein
MENTIGKLKKGSIIKCNTVPPSLSTKLTKDAYYFIVDVKERNNGIVYFTINDNDNNYRSFIPTLNTIFEISTLNN